MTTLSETEATAIKEFIKKEIKENLYISINDKEGWDYNQTYRTITIEARYDDELISSESFSIDTTKH